MSSFGSRCTLPIPKGELADFEIVAIITKYYVVSTPARAPYLASFCCVTPIQVLRRLVRDVFFSFQNARKNVICQVETVHILATSVFRTVDPRVTWRTCAPTVVANIAREFDIHTGLAIFPASSAGGLAFQPRR